MQEYLNMIFINRDVVYITVVILLIALDLYQKNVIRKKTFLANNLRKEITVDYETISDLEKSLTESEKSKDALQIAIDGYKQAEITSRLEFRAAEVGTQIAQRQALSFQDEVVALKILLESSDEYKNQVYELMINFFIKHKTLLWVGNLQRILMEDPVSARRTLMKLDQLRTDYITTDLALRDKIKAAPGNVTDLEQAVVDDQLFQSINLVVPVSEVTKLCKHAFELRMAAVPEPLALTNE